MFKKIGFYTKMGYKMLKKDVIGSEDYKIEYDQVSKTYDQWLDEMGKFTDQIIKPNNAEIKGKLNLLDFACGTGYITKSLIKKDIDCSITAVDFSKEMLGSLKSLKDDRVRLINGDGIEFLKNTDEKYDIIYFGWALSYFNYKELFPLFKKVLNPRGMVAIITNIQGTLGGIEAIFLKVMAGNPKEVIKPMDIKFNLPGGKDGLVKWFTKYGFKTLEVEEGEVFVRFDRPGELLQWLNKTGAAAGTACIFKDYSLITKELIREIKKEKYKNGQYEINHKFAYGIFQLN